jgi:hypothetical protein
MRVGGDAHFARKPANFWDFFEKKPKKG